MPIDTLLIQLGDLSAKIENVRSLLSESDPPSALTADDRATAAALLARLLAKKAELEDELRQLAKR